MIRRIALATVTVTTAALVPAITWSSSANATTPVATPWPGDTTVSVPLGRFTDMVVDQHDGLVFMAGVVNNFINIGYGGGVAAAHVDGSQMTKIAGTADATAITLGPDGQVYVAETSGDIAIIDPATLAVSKTVSTGTDGCPQQIAFAGAALWFSYSCGADNSSGIATLDPDSGLITSGISLTAASRILLRSVPDHADELLATQLQPQGGDLDLLSVSGATLTVAKEQDQVNALGLAFTDHGNTIVAANGTAGVAYSAADLSKRDSGYPVTAASTVAASTDGNWIAASAGQTSFNDVISTFATGSSAPIHTFDTSTPGSANPGQNNNPQPNGLAWSDDTLLAVYADYGWSSVVLKVLNTALQSPTAMTFSGPASAARTGHVTVSGQLPAELASTPVVIKRQDLSGTSVLATVVTDSAGKFSYTDTASIGGANTYSANFLGDQTHAPVSKTWNVAVSRQTVTMSLTLDHASYSYHQIAHLAIHVASHNQKTVQVWAKFGHEPLHLLRTLTLDSRGVARMDSMLTYDTVYQLRFAGDYVYNPRIIAATAYTRVAIVGGLNGYYGSAGAYRLFHAGGEAIITGRVAPDKTGGCLRFESQYYWQGRWVNGDSLACARMDYASGTGAYYQAAAGLPVRTRVVYNTEATNLGNASGWMYLMFR